MSNDDRISVFLEMPSDLDVAGSTEALRGLAKSIGTAKSGTAVSVEVFSRGTDMVNGISVRRTDGPVRIHYLDGALWIEGAQDKLDALARSIEFAASSGQVGEHLHVEYYDSHPYLDAGSIPLVVSQRAP